MWQLMKRDFMINRHFFIFIFLFPLIIYMINLPEPDVYTYSTLFIILIAQTFYMEKSNKANRVWVSLPIKRNYFVLSRYMFIFTVCILLLLYLLLVNYLFGNDSKSSLLILLAFITIVIVITFSIPIYYAFQSVWMSVIVNFLTLLIGTFILVFIFADPYELFEPFMLFFLNVIDFQPFVIITFFLIMLTYFSYVLSCYLFRTKDI